MNEFSHSDNLENIYEYYFPRVYNYVFYRILSKEQTEDIVSDIFLKVAENVFRFDAKKANFNTWIFTIVRNTLIDYYRLRKIHISIDDEENNVDPSIDFEEQCKLIEDEMLKELYKALTKIDNRTRLIIVLKHFEGLTNREISKRMDINESTVSSIYIRGLKKLREIIAA
ncbi:RNA polymerase sigma factor [Clostridiaceae bacterium UIB06]|uniref:RNA polymerase sigma factor n=1 Tax=Clostridium thailandense TaxID=2794346 RepID=A0A949TGN3_9CLOT|nr:RNA polymerase sigma factor [Clostridium thailandense]MBV7272454.1 RNA polymerase sigma factor [Clostridium thailandense]MCH5136978.1 RNA polymerase sigma factor [Clostridiaceae bacterium UIB06]